VIFIPPLMGHEARMREMRDVG